MSNRYTIKDAEHCAKQLADVMNVPFITSEEYYKIIGERGTKKQIGHWKMGSAYGNVVIQEIINEGGGVRHPVSGTPRKPKEFCEAIHFTMQVMDYKKKRK